MPRQLSFDLDRGAALGDRDFFVSAANRRAHDLVLDPAGWPQGKLALIGPEGAGKSHLLRIWSARTGARILGADDPDLARLAGTARPAPDALIAVEDLERLPPDAEEALFHLHNHLAARGRLLLTGRTPPARWPIALPDLASRLQATALAQVGDPDDPLLFALLTKHFADRQLAPAPDVVPWLVQRLERSHAAARAAVAALDAAALDQGREITRAFARAVLDKGRGPGA